MCWSQGQARTEAGGVFRYHLAPVTYDAGKDASLPGTQPAPFLEGDLDMDINM